jgi:type II secretory pathway pseudopilin PulG
LVVLILVGGLAIAGERSLQASRETAAAQSVQSFTANATTYQRSWGGFPVTAEAMGGLGSTATATCTADEEMAIPTGTATYETGIVNGGYKFQYTISGPFSGNSCAGAPASVETGYEFFANAVDGKTKNFCADSSGVFYLPAGTPWTGGSSGCLAEQPAALAIGQ